MNTKVGGKALRNQAGNSQGWCPKPPDRHGEGAVELLRPGVALLKASDTEAQGRAAPGGWTPPPEPQRYPGDLQAGQEGAGLPCSLQTRPEGLAHALLSLFRLLNRLRDTSSDWTSKDKFC